MARDDERDARSKEEPVVGGLPDVSGILVAMRLSEGLATHLRGLADELLVNDFAGSTLTRAERELIATAVSAGNDCFYCMDSHGAFASALLRRANATDIDAIVDGVKTGGAHGVGAKMQALLVLARTVQRNARDVTRERRRVSRARRRDRGARLQRRARAVGTALIARGLPGRDHVAPLRVTSTGWRTRNPRLRGRGRRRDGR